MFLKEEVIHTIVIEKSEFITYMKRCDSVEEYKEYLSSIKKKHYDATHHCSAFISNEIKRSSDDGEPAGTAGVPILSTLEKKGMENTCAIVVRYFGGIKLGAGGLIRAYGNAVSETIARAKCYEEVLIDKYEISLPYDVAQKLDHYLRSHTTIIDTAYDLEVTYTYITNDDIIDDIKAITRGKAPTFIAKEIIQKEIRG